MLSIPSPNTDRTLLTLAELRAAAGVTDTSRDAELTLLGGYISAIITNACQVTRAGATPPTLRLESVVETFRIGSPATQFYNNGLVGHGQQALRPTRLPIVSITSIVESGTTLSASNYEVDGALIYRMSSATARMPWCTGPVVVSYDAGWATVPDDLRYAAMKFVQAALLQQGRDPMLRRKVTIGVSEYEWWVDPTKDNVVPPEVMDILCRGRYVNKWAWMR